MYFTQQWFLEAEQQFKQLSGPAKFDPIDIQLLPGAVLKKQRFYPLSQQKYRAAQDLVQDYLNRDILRHSYSPYSSPVLIVPKPGGRWRFVSDFRELNLITKLDAYPLPLISGVMARVSRGKVYALIDLKDGFYQLQITPQASEYCAVALPFGLYEFTRLVMGWTNAPANFQRKINQMLTWGITNNYIDEDTVEAYVDDLLVYAQDMQSLFQHVNKLLTLLIHFNMAIIPSKCHFGVTSAKYLGFILIPGGKTLSQQITDRIKEKLHNIWLESANETDETKIVRYTQKIIGTLVYFQQFIPRFTVKARFLFNKLKEKTPFTSDDKNKLQQIINELAEHHTIYSPDANKETEVFTDASNYHMGYAAFQDGKIIDLGSKKLQTQKVIASTTEREIATIRFAIKKLTPIINIQTATIHTDHKPILGLLKTPLNLLNNALATIVNEITQSGATIAYIKGKNNILADALSRRSNFEIPDNQIQINTRPEMNDVETNPGPANMDSRPDSRYTPQQKEVIARRKETSRALREIKQRKGDTTQRTVIHEMWEIHCLEKKDELSQLIQNPTLPVKPTETHRSPHRVPGDMWEMLSRLDAPLEDEDAVRRLKPEIQQGEWFHLIRIIPQLKNQNWINHQKSYQKHQLRHNRRPEMNDVETNPGPYSPQQLEFIKRQKPVFQALEEINKRKGIQQEATIHQVISLQQKDQEIQTIQDSSSYSQPKETKKNFYKNISKEMWTKLANLDAPLNNWRAVNRLFPLLQNRENSAIRREVAIARFNLRHNSRPDMNDVEMNPGPVQAILKILVILTCCLTTQTSGQIIPFGENYAQSQKGLSSQICLVQRKANNTQLRK